MNYRIGRARSDALAKSARGEVRHWKVPGLSGLRIGGSIGKAAEAIKKNIPSVGGMIGSATGIAGGGVLGSVLGGANPLDDLKKGAQVASVIVPAIGAGTKTAGTVAGGGSESDPYGDGMPGVFDPSAAGGSDPMGVVGKYIKDHWQELVKAGLVAGTSYEAYKNNQQANQLTNDALARLKTPSVAPDLSSIFADQGNPYARNRKVPVVGRSA